MRMRSLPLVVVLTLVLVGAAGARADAQPIPPGCTTDSLPSGALSLICVPPGWNGQLVVFAHGYIEVRQPLGLYNLQLADGTSLPTVIQALGFAFATTSYRKNGLAILEGIADIRELVAAFKTRVGPPARTFIAGVSEGGAVAALLAERSPDLFTGALAACGPVGSFWGQIEYIGDFRVLFDYYFPGVIPGSPISIPAEVIANWTTVYVPRILGAIAANPSGTLELLKVARVPFEPADPTTVARSVIGLLWYNVLGTNDAKAMLGGNPYDNRFHWYFGSSNDLRLNLRVRRVAASAAALKNLRPYETTGRLKIPLVSLHTTRDEIVPVWHELLYGLKARTSERGIFVPVPVDRYGHCNFNATEVLTAFVGLLSIP